MATVATTIEEDCRMGFQDLVCTHNMSYGPFKRQQIVARDRWFQRDDAPVHSATLAKKLLAARGGHVLLKISFSYNLKPADFFLSFLAKE